MLLFPAIDLKDGACVRLYKGDMDQATVFNNDPAAQARAFVDAGAEWLHIVDLNGAFKGEPVNAAAVASILKAVPGTPVQLGGGIRTLDVIEDWLGRGVRRVILGTVALREPNLVKRAALHYPGKIVVGIDARGGRVAVQGWAETSEMTAVELARRFEDVGVAAIVYTDIDRDGMMQGVNVEATVAMAKASSLPIIASGGITNLDDIKALLARAHEGAGICGAITGRAIYEGTLDLAAAQRLCDQT